jgi:hypothetical protein
MCRLYHGSILNTRFLLLAAHAALSYAENKMVTLKRFSAECSWWEAFAID